METKTTTKQNPWANTPRPNVVSLVRECGGIFRYAFAIERSFERYFEAIGNPYKRKTTFANDFALAECYGDNSIKDTYKRASRDWMSNRDYITELALVLNWYSWFWYDNGEPALSKLYADLFYQCKDAFYKAWKVKKTDSAEERARKEDAQSYFFHTLD